MTGRAEKMIMSRERKEAVYKFFRLTPKDQFEVPLQSSKNLERKVIFSHSSNWQVPDDPDSPLLAPTG